MTLWGKHLDEFMFTSGITGPQDQIRVIGLGDEQVLCCSLRQSHLNLKPDKAHEYSHPMTLQ